MDRSQTALVLAKIAMFDRRTIGDADVLAWHEALEDLDYATCLAAVTSYYRDNRQWVMPSDIREHCATVTAHRIRKVTRVDTTPYGTWFGTAQNSFKIIGSYNPETFNPDTDGDYHDLCRQDAVDYAEIKRRIGSGNWGPDDYSAYLAAGLVLEEYDQRKAIAS